MRLVAAVAALLSVGCLEKSGRFDEEPMPTPSGGSTTTMDPPTSSPTDAAPGETTTSGEVVTETANDGSTTVAPTSMTTLASDTTYSPDTEQFACGDGVVDGFEECDDGNGSNADECLNDCTSAACGDGFIWDGVEACDDGDQDDMDACPSTCQKADCGDGFLFAGVEECDDGNTVNGDGCEDFCLPSKPLLIFVTKQKFTGDLGGFIGADAKCQLAADLVPLPGVFKAWLSANDKPAANRIVHADIPYRRTDDEIVANNWVELTSGQLLAPILLTETKEEVVADPQVCGMFPAVFTNTKFDGTTAEVNHDCKEWTTDTGGPTTFGNATVLGAAWSSICKPANGCTRTASLYCIQVPA